MKAKHIAWVAAVALLGAACDSPLNVDPLDSVDAETALNDARSVELAVRGGYRSFQTSALYNREMTIYPELYADNLQWTGTFATDAEVFNRNIQTSNSAIRDAWRNSYVGINRANNVLAATSSAKDLTAENARLYKGEALFVRALHYFDLVRYFGGVPIVTEPTRQVTEASNLARSSLAETYTQIEKDLTEAATLLPAQNEAGRATLGAANALLARVYLEQGKWTQARDRATAVISSTRYQLVSNYRSIFTTKNSAESIFELQYSVNNSNALAFWYFPQSLGGRRGIAPSASLNSAFEAGDTRKAAQIAATGTGALYGIKFSRIAAGDDNVPVLRLADMYLTRAEANARLNATPAVVLADVNAVRQRAGLAPLNPATVSGTEALIDAILKERRVEFAMEGHRFFDLRRTGRATQVLGIPAFRLLFPIPQSERDVNPKLDQNPGY